MNNFELLKQNIDELRQETDIEKKWEIFESRIGSELLQEFSPNQVDDILTTFKLGIQLFL